MLEQGSQFPEFTLSDQTGTSHSLKDYAGKWLVVYFYPKDNTSGCTTEALAFTAYSKDFTEAGAVIFGVSPDSVKSHAGFAEKQQLSFTLLSDPEHVLLEAVGAWQKKKMYGREYMGVVRSTFLVDPRGVVRFVWPKVKVAGHALEVLEKLKELQA